ncbi:MULTISPECIES: hypothetical protein [unclassified Rhodococcus (in: high G+C Gram-positive bacteria)]|uniref:hypothetical protein n=1 Tax=unclassified Rhodococcus (in: high G+C Gram-positive bacteria) TaxID=192944 RepID=UPI001445F092|nr:MULTISPECIES: hypothetical protein [unclassified Rhodococcus (in: high G+C Gram-positive bacteria)]
MSKGAQVENFGLSKAAARSSTDATRIEPAAQGTQVKAGLHLDPTERYGTMVRA